MKNILKLSIFVVFIQFIMLSQNAYGQYSIQATYNILNKLYKRSEYNVLNQQYNFSREYDLNFLAGSIAIASYMGNYRDIFITLDLSINSDYTSSDYRSADNSSLYVNFFPLDDSKLFIISTAANIGYNLHIRDYCDTFFSIGTGFARVFLPMSNAHLFPNLWQIHTGIKFTKSIIHPYISTKFLFMNYNINNQQNLYFTLNSFEIGMEIPLSDHKSEFHK